jgi:ABC-type hemin transport system ATPase subunit
MKVQIEKGRALVLAGPQGCGKTRLARKLAAEAGPYAEISAEAARCDFNLSRLLAHRLAVIIVDEATAATFRSPELRELITTDEAVAHGRGRPEELVPAPNFIFCTGDVNAVGELAGDRRFFVVRVDELKDPQ